MTSKYHFENSNGQHAHFLGNHPLIGTSRVTGILAKPLTWWASGLAVQAFGCLDPKVLTKIKNGKATLREKADHKLAMETALKAVQRMDVDQYSTLIDRAYRAHATSLKDKAVEGTDLHAELERFVKCHMELGGKYTEGIHRYMYPEHIFPFITWTNDNVKRFLWAEGHCYSERHWLGGISDCGYEANDGTFGIIDFKSAKEAYFEHFMQIGGYDLQISENGVFDAEGNQLYTLEKPITKYAVVPFGAKNVEPRFYESPETAHKVFLAMLTVYQAMPKE